MSEYKESIRMIKDTLIKEVLGQLDNLDHTCASELGEVVDAIKDCYEICKLEEEYKYYKTITEAMDENTPTWQEPMCNCHRMEIEPIEEYHSKSEIARKAYMESKHHGKDKATQLKELDKYIQELSSEMMEMTEGIGLDEKQYIEKKLQSLINKILNG